MNNDVIIVGGGVIGCSVALKLAEAGLGVTVFERGRVGCEASRAAAGMLAAQSETTVAGPFSDLCLQSRSMYRKFADHLTEASGIDVEYDDSGLLFVMFDDEDSTTQWVSSRPEAGAELERLSASTVRELEPAVAESAAGAVFVRGDHQIENRRLMDALGVAIRRAGVRVVEGVEISALTTERGRVTGVVSDGDRIAAGVVIVAGGAWSSRLIEPLGLKGSVVPARGQMIALKGQGCSINRVLHSSKVYLVPRRDGRILIGATVEYAGFEKAVTVEGVRSLLSAATELVPSLMDLQIVEMWSGLRPDTVDHLPILGPAGVEGLVIATGHFRNGILLAPVTAELLSELILTGRTPSGLAPFLNDRLQVCNESNN